MVAPSINLESHEKIGINQDDAKRKNRFWLRIPLSKGLQFTLDLVILAEAFTLAYLLRFDFSVSESDFVKGLMQLPVVMLSQVVALRLTGVYRFIWRYIGMAELAAFFKAALLSSLPLLVLRFLLPQYLSAFRVPVSIIFIDTVLAFGLILGMRVVRRALYERYERRQTSATLVRADKRSVLLIGAGRAGVMTAKEIINRGDLNFEIKGFIDDDPNKQGAVIQGVKVLGKIDSLPYLVSQLAIDQVVITLAQVTRPQMRRILDICESAQVKVKIIPGLYEILQGRVNVSRLRDLQVEDLLARDQVTLDEEDAGRFLTGKVVMVTGAGGSIGSELARQIAHFQPAMLLLVERSEFALFNITQEMREVFPDLATEQVLADIGDDSRMRSVFTRYCPQVIFHAAAHKHVPMMELTPSEAIKNNTLASYSLGKLAGEFLVDVFVLISTDKAVRPTSVMGASKRISELVIQYLNTQFPTRYVAVRFGNVIGSAGSVIPVFQEQIRRGGPVTVTHPDMMRYFMTIPEASQLVLQAGAMGEGGEIFVLDMGEPVSILDLAKDVITLSGLKPYEDIDIVFTGIRPGEKLNEELEMTHEKLTKTRHQKIFIGNIALYPPALVGSALKQFAILSKQGNDLKIRALINQILSEAQIDDGKDGKSGKPVKDMPQPFPPLIIGRKSISRAT